MTIKDKRNMRAELTMADVRAGIATVIYMRGTRLSSVRAAAKSHRFFTFNCRRSL